MRGREGEVDRDLKTTVRERESARDERERERERPQDDWERGRESERRERERERETSRRLGERERERETRERERERERPQDDCPRVDKSLQVTRAAKGADEFLTHLAFNRAVFEVHAAELTQVQPLPA